MQTTLPTGTSSAPSPLMALPAEIRNRIMEFTLTSSARLHHRPPRPRNSHHIIQVRRQHRLVEEKRIGGGSPHPSFNVVKLVCRQLYNETAGLEIQHNAILFTSHKMRPHNRNALVQSMNQPVRKVPEAWFFDFVTPMTSKKLEWLSTVIIASDRASLSMLNSVAPVMENISMLAHFCKQHPKIKMCYQFPNFCFDDLDRNPSLQFLTVGTVLTLALQGDEAGFKAAADHLPYVAWTRALIEAATVWRDAWGIDYVLRGVKNFSFTPVADTREDDVLANMLLCDALALEAGEIVTSKWAKIWGKSILEWKENGVGTGQPAHVTLWGM